MAEANAGDKGNGAADEEKKTESGFKLNAGAPEFVPNSPHSPTVPLAGVFHPWYGFLAGDGLLGTDWFHIIGQEPLHVFSDAAVPSSHDSSTDALHKIVKQVPLLLQAVHFLVVVEHTRPASSARKSEIHFVRKTSQAILLVGTE